MTRKNAVQRGAVAQLARRLRGAKPSRSNAKSNNYLKNIAIRVHDYPTAEKYFALQNKPRYAAPRQENFLPIDQPKGTAMTYKFDDFTSLFSVNDNPALAGMQKAGATARTAVEGVAREQIAAASDLLDLSLNQFETLTSASDLNAIISANQQWLTGSFDIVSKRSANAVQVLQDAAGVATEAPKKKTTRSRKAA
jgi:hypothetical protein